MYESVKIINNKWVRSLDPKVCILPGQELTIEETGIGLVLVSHLRRPSGDRGHENGREVTLSQLRGSGSIGHLSDIVIALERNQQSDDEDIANTTTIRVVKNRYTGDLGAGCYLFYDKNTGRLSEVANPYEDHNGW